MLARLLRFTAHPAAVVLPSPNDDFGEGGLLTLWGAVLRQAWEDVLAALQERLDTAVGIHAAVYLHTLIDHGLPLPPDVENKLTLLLGSASPRDLVLGGLFGWQNQFLEEVATCLICGGEIREWRSVLAPPRAHKRKDWVWRYRLPENHIPVCVRCVRSRGVKQHLPALARAVWGARFHALTWVHQRAREDPRFSPDWDETLYPLWPPEAAAGLSWEEGGGNLDCAIPRFPWNVHRSPEDRKAARDALEAIHHGTRRPVAPPDWFLSILEDWEVENQ